jgi:hypothetical protein
MPENSIINSRRSFPFGHKLYIRQVWPLIRKVFLIHLFIVLFQTMFMQHNQRQKDLRTYTFNIKIKRSSQRGGLMTSEEGKMKLKIDFEIYVFRFDWEKLRLQYFDRCL